MLKVGQATCPTSRSVLFLTLAAFLVSACGLGMTSEARLKRMQQAYEQGEYRAAIIDAKNALLEQPENVAARLVLGRASLELGDAVSAEKELRRAVELGADANLVVVDLGRSLLMQQKFEELIAEVTPELVTAGTDRLFIIRMRGDALLGMQRPIAARGSYTQVLKAGDDIAAQLGVVNTYIAERNYSPARDSLDRLLSSDENHVLAWLASGSLGMLTGSPERAARDYGKAAKLARKKSDVALEVQALSGFTDALLVQNKVDQARPALDRMEEIAPQDTRTLVISARLAVSDKDWTTAQGDLQEILQRVPDYRPAQLLLGVAHKESGNLGQAEMYLSTVVAAAPGNAHARRLLAETRIELDKADEARQALEPIVSDPRADVDSLATAARASLILGEFEDAAKLLQRSVAAEPDNVDLRIQLAFAYFRTGNGDYAAARNSLDESSRLAPDDMRPIKFLAQLDELEGNYRSAKERYLLVLESQPKSPPAMMALARLAARDEAYDETRDWLEEARKADATAIAPRAILGSLYLALGEFATAEEVIEEAIDLDRDNAQLHNVLGLAQFSQDDFSDAELSFEEAMELNANEQSYRLNMARAQAKRGNAAGARKTLLQPTDGSLQHIPSAVLLASLTADAGDLDGAITIARRLRELHPDEAAPCALEAELLARGGDFPGASAAYDRALSVQNLKRYAVRSYQIRSKAGLANQVDPLISYLRKRPLDTNMKIYLAQAYQGMQENGKASAQYEQVLLSEPGNVIAANNLAWIYLEDGDPGAEKVARRAYAIQPDNASVVDTLGWILVKKGALSDGIALLRNAAELEDRPEVRYHLAAALIAAGDVEEASGFLREILSTDAIFASRQDAENLLLTL